MLPCLVHAISPSVVLLRQSVIVYIHADILFSDSDSGFKSRLGVSFLVTVSFLPKWLYFQRLLSAANHVALYKFDYYYYYYGRALFPGNYTLNLKVPKCHMTAPVHDKFCEVWPVPNGFVKRRGAASEWPTSLINSDHWVGRAVGER